MDYKQEALKSREAKKNLLCRADGGSVDDIPEPIVSNSRSGSSVESIQEQHRTGQTTENVGMKYPKKPADESEGLRMTKPRADWEDHYANTSPKPRSFSPGASSALSAKSKSKAAFKNKPYTYDVQMSESFKRGGKVKGK